MMLALSIAALVYGVTLGSVLSRYPYYRSPIAIGVLSVIMVIWATVLLWPGHAPIWLLVVLVLVLAVPAPTITAVMTFDIARTSNPPRRLGSAIGVVNGGAFLGTLTAVMAIGLVLQVTTPPGSTDYSLASFKWAFATQYLLGAVGIGQTLRYRRRMIPASSSSATPMRMPHCAAVCTCRHRREEETSPTAGPISVGSISGSYRDDDTLAVTKIRTIGDRPFRRR